MKKAFCKDNWGKLSEYKGVRTAVALEQQHYNGLRVDELKKHI